MHPLGMLLGQQMFDVLLGEKRLVLELCALPKTLSYMVTRTKLRKLASGKLGLTRNAG